MVNQDEQKTLLASSKQEQPRRAYVKPRVEPLNTLDTCGVKANSPVEAGPTGPS